MSHTLRLIIGGVLAVIGIGVFLGVLESDNQNALGVAAIAGPLLALYIAIVQWSQVRELREVADRTASTAEALRVDDIIRRNVSRFLRTDGHRAPIFVCAFPVEFDRKPLPLINSGDFYAVKILSECIGRENFRLNPVTHDRPGIRHESANRIYLCSPTANVALRENFPSWTSNANGDVIQEKAAADLPCWFHEEERDGLTTRTIRVDSKKTKLNIKPIESDADQAYREAHALGAGESYDPFFEGDGSEEKDYGIIARLSDDQSTTLIAAGIHQFGTWGVAEYLACLMQGGTEARESFFFEPNDFVAVVWGRFDYQKLTVVDVNLHEDCVWTRNGTEDWELVSGDKRPRITTPLNRARRARSRQVVA